MTIAADAVFSLFSFPHYWFILLGLVVWFPLFPIFAWRHTLYRFDGLTEIVWHTKPDFKADLFHAFFAETEELLCFCDADVQEVVDDRLSVLLHEYLGQVVLVDVEHLSQLIQGDLGSVVLFQILLHIGYAGPFFAVI